MLGLKRALELKNISTSARRLLLLPLSHHSVSPPGLIQNSRFVLQHAGLKSPYCGLFDNKAVYRLAGVCTQRTLRSLPGSSVVLLKFWLSPHFSVEQAFRFFIKKKQMEFSNLHYIAPLYRNKSSSERYWTSTLLSSSGDNTTNKTPASLDNNIIANFSKVLSTGPFWFKVLIVRKKNLTNDRTR